LGSFRVLARLGATSIALVLLGSACGSGADAPPAGPTPAPSAAADALFQTGLDQMQGTASLRFETELYAGDTDTLISRRLDEQVAPDRGRQTLHDVKSGSKSTATIVGRRVVQVTVGEEPIETELSEAEAFTYPGTWKAEYGNETGFSIVRDETLEGRDATLIRQWRPDPARPGGYAERLIWIDKETGRILRWDVSKYLMDGDKPRRAQRFVSSLWEFDADLTIELPS